MKTKSFDCIAMKAALQLPLREEESCVGALEAARLRRQRVQSASNPLAGWWKSLQAGPANREAFVAVVREDNP